VSPFVGKSSDLGGIEEDLDTECKSYPKDYNRTHTARPVRVEVYDTSDHARPQVSMASHSHNLRARDGKAPGGVEEPENNCEQPKPRFGLSSSSSSSSRRSVPQPDTSDHEAPQEPWPHGKSVLPPEGPCRLRPKCAQAGSALCRRTRRRACMNIWHTYIQCVQLLESRSDKA
jgi:hypothetical protein